MPETIPDETDSLAMVETLKAECAVLTTALATANAALVESNSLLVTSLAGVVDLTAKTEAQAASITTLTTERDDLRLKAEPVEKQLAALATKLGLSNKAAVVTDAPTVLTETEKCQAARGGK